MNRLDAIEARVAAVTECDCDEDATWCRHMTELTVNRSFVPMLLRSRTDVPLLLAAVRAARNVLALFVEQSAPNGYECRDCGADVTLAPAFMKPETHDADCEVRPLLAALAPLLEPEP